MEGKRYSIVSDYENVDWVKVIPILIAFAHKLLSKQKFKQDEITELASDCASEAITCYLEEREKFDPSKNPDLILYLKYSLLQRIISNHLKSSYNKQKSGTQLEDLTITSKLIEQIPIDEAIDIKDIVGRIHNDIKHDDVMSIIFDARYEENMKRAEICEVFSIENQTFDNAMKRLKRIVEKHVN